jgi:hypothetical protein
VRAHRTDPVSLTFALIFLAIAAWWLVAKISGLTVPDVGWFVAGLLIVVGVLGLLAAMRTARSPATPVTAPPDAPGDADADRDRDSSPEEPRGSEHGHLP